MDEKPHSVLRVPGGRLRIVASAENEASARYRTEHPLPASIDKIELVEYGSKVRQFPCGHGGTASFKLKIYSDELTAELGNRDWCPDCFLAKAKRHAIRCALCGLSIVPGQAIALYPSEEGEAAGIRFDISTRVDDCVIGCMRWLCYPSGGFFAGHWSENGFKAYEFKQC
jgi:hypothetical protein